MEEDPNENAEEGSAELLPEAQPEEAPPPDGEQNIEVSPEQANDSEEQSPASNALPQSEEVRTTVDKTVGKEATMPDIDEREEDLEKPKGKKGKDKGKKKEAKEGESKEAKAKPEKKGKAKGKKAEQDGGGEGDTEQDETPKKEEKLKKEKPPKEKKQGKTKKADKGEGEGDIKDHWESQEEGKEPLEPVIKEKKEKKGKGDKKGKDEKKKEKDVTTEETEFDFNETWSSMRELSSGRLKSNLEERMALPGVKQITISPETQQKLGCEIGVNVTSESPWIPIDKELLDDHLFLHSDSSDFLPLKEELQEVKMTSILVGYDALNDEPNQFFVCLTESAKETVLQMLEEMKIEQQRRLERALQKTPKEWTSFGSEEEVELFTVKSSRPHVRVLIETPTENISKAYTFSDRNAEDVRDGYYAFTKKEEPADQIWCYRLEAGVQVRNPSVEAESQTQPSIPFNAWTQYEYDVDTEAPIEDEAVLKALSQFLERVEAPMSEVLSYNEILDNYRDDYGKLVVDDEDTDVPLNFSYSEFVSFTDMKHCQGKAVSCVAFHPMWTGIVAIAYVDQRNIDVQKVERTDEIAHAVYSINRVLIWSVNDAFKPKLILESPREVYSLAFAPHRSELLVGGLSNGQIVIWDIKGKIERVETEIKLTPAQIRHNLAMMNMMDWMKQTIHIQYLRPVAVSSLQHSHTDKVYEIRFLHPNWTISYSGKFEFIEDAKTTLLLSVSMDTTMLIWNLDPETNPVVTIAGRSRKRRTARRPEGLKSEVSPYAVFHRAISPSLKIDMPVTGERSTGMFRSMDMYIPRIQYIPDEEEWAKITPKQKESSATRFKFLPNLTTAEDEVQLEAAFIGTVSGKILAAEWSESEPKGSTMMQNLNTSIKYVSHIHNGPVLKVVRSPFLKDVYLTIDWDKFAVWSTKLKDTPFLCRRQKGAKRYLSGSWSFASAMIFRLCCSDGSIEVWNLETRSETYTFHQNVSGKSLNIVEGHPRSLPSNVIGVADSTGCFRMFFIPIRNQETPKDCEEKLKKMIDREVERTSTMKQWVADWMRKNGDRLKREKSKEAKAHGQEVVSVRPPSQKGKEEPIAIIKERGTKKVEKYDPLVTEMKRKNMMKVMMEKKRIDREDLERKRAPLLQAQQAMQLKQLKLREAIKNRNTIFREYVEVMFPNVAEKPPPKPTDCEILAAQLEEKEDVFIQDYYELEAIALAKLRKPDVVDSFNWKRVVQEGRQRREVLDLELYHQTEWKKRAEERRIERRLHRESELRQEDAKRRRKKALYPTTSSQMIMGSGSTIFDEDGEVEWNESHFLTPSTGSKMSVKHKPSSRMIVKQKESKATLTQNESNVAVQPQE